MQLKPEEARLIAVRRAIEKFGQPQLLNIADASVITAYINELVDLDQLEEKASETQLSYFLDGLVTGIVTTRLVDAEIPLEQLPKSQLEAAKQFQTGVDPVSGDVKVQGG